MEPGVLCRAGSMDLQGTRFFTDDVAGGAGEAVAEPEDCNSHGPSRQSGCVFGSFLPAETDGLSPEPIFPSSWACGF